MGNSKFDFGEFYKAYRQQFIRFTYNYVRDEVIAEDIVSEAMIYYWENESRLSDTINPAAYILTSIKNKCIDFLRRERMKQEVEDDLALLHTWELDTRIASLEELNPRDIFSKEIMTITQKTLERLPEQTRVVFTMSRFDQLSHKEIAARLGISTKTVEFHITKAIKALRIELQDYLPLIWLSVYLDYFVFLYHYLLC